MIRMLLFPLAAALLFCCAPGEEGGSESSADQSVESYQLVDVTVFNETIIAASAAGDSWAADAVDIARKFIDSPGARSVNIQRQDDPGERADSTTIIIVEDGYLDDSMRGTWHRFRMARTGDRTWRIVEVRRAYRCWRGDHRDHYSEELCP